MDEEEILLGRSKVNQHGKLWVPLLVKKNFKLDEGVVVEWYCKGKELYIRLV